jgi:protein-L-isoaspartate(D-aspartate) O-methyltransferase
MSDYSTARQKMVDGQVRTSDVTDRRIIDAMLSLPREQFVPEGGRALAYLDFDLDVSEGRSARRYLIKPMLTAKLLQAARLGTGDNVLIVGCATGYVAALAAQLAGKVTATDGDAELITKGNEVLVSLGLQASVTFHVAEAAEGYQKAAPYDVVVLNGATEIPLEMLCGQLNQGGRLVGVFAASRPPRAMIVTRSQDDFGRRVLFDASAPVLPGLERVPAFVF